MKPATDLEPFVFVTASAVPLDEPQSQVQNVYISRVYPGPTSGYLFTERVRTVFRISIYSANTL